MPEEVSITMNEQLQRFETSVGDEFAYVDYRWYQGDLALMHTFVPPEGRGGGLAMMLAKHVLEYAKEKKLQIMVYCPVIAKYIKMHPEYEYLKDKKYHG